MKTRLRQLATSADRCVLVELVKLAREKKNNPSNVFLRQIACSGVERDCGGQMVSSEVTR